MFYVLVALSIGQTPTIDNPALALAAAARGRAAECCDADTRPSYAEAKAQAIRENKPLIVWTGTGDVLCPACVQTLNGEAVHYVAATFPDTPARAIVVGVPRDGELIRAATITRWVTGDSRWGHVPSVRRAVYNFREHGRVMSAGWSLPAYGGPEWAPPADTPAAPVMQFTPARFAGPGLSMAAGRCGSRG